jgi:hypothetical protein
MDIKLTGKKVSILMRKLSGRKSYLLKCVSALRASLWWCPKVRRHHRAGRWENAGQNLIQYPLIGSSTNVKCACQVRPKGKFLFTWVVRGTEQGPNKMAAPNTGCGDSTHYTLFKSHHFPTFAAYTIPDHPPNTHDIFLTQSAASYYSYGGMSESLASYMSSIVSVFI